MDKYDLENFGAMSGCLIFIGISLVLGGLTGKLYYAIGGIMITFGAYMAYVRSLIKRMNMELPLNASKSV